MVRGNTNKKQVEVVLHEVSAKSIASTTTDFTLKFKLQGVYYKSKKFKELPWSCSMLSVMSDAGPMEEASSYQERDNL